MVTATLTRGSTRSGRFDDDLVRDIFLSRLKSDGKASGNIPPEGKSDDKNDSRCDVRSLFPSFRERFSPTSCLQTPVLIRSRDIIPYTRKSSRETKFHFDEHSSEI